MLSTAEAADATLGHIVEATRTSLWNMQRHWNVHDLRNDNGLDEILLRNGVELRLILPRRVARDRCPLASSHLGAALRIAPVAHPLLLSDQQRILVGDSTGETIWTSSDPGVVARAVSFYQQAWQGASPAVPEGDAPPFTRRMVDIAFHLVDGSTDREIARSLGVSERTVSADVRELANRLGARSRAHAIALVSGLDG